MMERLEAYGRAAGEDGVARTVARVAEAVREVPGVSAEIGDGRVVLTGQGLWRLPALRWIAGLLQ